MKSNIIIIAMTESLMTSRGNRHPALAQHLFSQGYNIKYITSNFYHAEKRWFSKNEIKESKKNAPYEILVINKIGYFKNVSIRRVISNFFFSLKAFFLLKKILDKNTLIVIPSRPVELIFFCSVIRRIYKNSVLIDIQDIWPDMLVNKSGIETFIFTKYCNFFLNNSLQYINKFIHVAPSFKNWLRRYSSSSSSKFIPLGYDEKRWGVVNTKKTTNKNKIKFTVIAQLTHQFDIMPLLEAIKENQKFELTLIGEDGNGERFEEVRNYIKDNKIKNFRSLGFLKTNQLKIEMQNCDIGIVPMISTSIPNKVFDYIANENPIYVLGENDASNFVKKNNFGWFSKYTTEGVKSFLCQINHDDIDLKRTNLGKVKHQFSREIMHKKITDIIER